jgi:glycosyltransferase involved in cell wall biosynthesis
MTHLIYLANMRLPTEKAHGLQIMQNCEAFANAGAHVDLWLPRRARMPDEPVTNDVWAFYGVAHHFHAHRLLCLDLFGVIVVLRLVALTPLLQAAFFLQQFTFILSVLIAALFTRADIFYSRDIFVLLALSLIKTRQALAYEAHSLQQGRIGAWMQRQMVRRVGTVIAITQRLRDDLIARGADPARTITAHDGVRAARFANLPERSVACQRVGWDESAFIVGYMGRLHTMGMDKGVGLLIEAIQRITANSPLEAVSLAIVGGPDEMADALRQQWIAAGLPAERFLYAGQVKPDDVPLYLRAFDVCAMPFPFTEHFAYYASPIKLFEYMAVERPILASDLPSTAEVVTHDHSALLYPPGDAAALATQLKRLIDDADLRARLAAQARADVFAHYTWDARAKLILDTIRSAQPE